jgi:hypothetical protein
VGEVMAISRKFEEALQRRFACADIGVGSLVGNENFKFNDLEKNYRPTHERIFSVPTIQQGYSIDASRAFIDKWFLYKIKNVVEIESRLRGQRAAFPVNFSSRPSAPVSLVSCSSLV